MQRMGLQAITAGPHPGKPSSGHKICPYLLRNVVIDRVNQVGCKCRLKSAEGGVAIDRSSPFIKAIRSHLPNADIVHDRFHISKHLNESADKTLRKEHRMMLKNEDERFTGTKYSWLKGMEHLSDEALE